MRFDIFQLTLRQLLGFHRFGFFILVLFIIGLPVFAAGAASAVEAAATSSNFNPEEFLAGLFQGSQLPIFYPIVILFLASMALREEIDNNTIVYLWTKPISRASIVLSKFSAAFVVASVLCGLSAAITSLIIYPSEIPLAAQFVLASIVGLLAYGGLFFTLSLISGRTMAVIIGMSYAIIWEGLLSRVSPLTSNLSIRHYATNFAANVIDIDRYLEPSLSLVTSLLVLLGITAVLLSLSIWKFSKMEFAGES